MGFIDKDEKPEEAAKRELLEETGFSGDIFSLGSFLLAPSFTKTTGYVFGASNAKKEHNIKDIEIDKIITVSESKLEDLINTNQLRGVSSICAYLLMKRKSHVR